MNPNVNFVLINPLPPPTRCDPFLIKAGVDWGSNDCFVLDLVGTPRPEGIPSWPEGIPSWPEVSGAPPFPPQKSDALIGGGFHYCTIGRNASVKGYPMPE